MSDLRTRLWIAALAALVLLPPMPAHAQAHRARGRALASNIIVPQSRSFAVDRRRRVEITGVTTPIEDRKRGDFLPGGGIERSGELHATPRSPG